MELGMGVEDTDGKTGRVNFPCRASLVLRSVQYSTVQDSTSIHGRRIYSTKYIRTEPTMKPTMYLHRYRVEDVEDAEDWSE